MDRAIRAASSSPITTGRRGNHVRYGKRWVTYLLEDDMRTEEDVLAKCAPISKK